MIAFSIMDNPQALLALTGPLTVCGVVFLLRRCLTSIEVSGPGGRRLIARFRKS